MNSLKKLLFVSFFLIASNYLCLLSAIDIEASITSGNFVFNKSGSMVKIPDFGFKLIFNENLGKNIDGTLSIKRDVGIGNTILGRIAYNTDLINISIGPTLSIFNAGFENKDIITLFQPGIGTSVSFKLPVGFFTSLDTNFSIPLATTKKKNVYLQDGFFDIGWRLPNVIISAKISQKNKSIIEGSNETHISITDIGIYTTSYSKPSRIRIPLNLFYRINHFQNSGSVNEKVGNIVLETGVFHAISGDIEWFSTFGASVFSFSLINYGTFIKKFFFDCEIGVKFSIN